MLGHPWCTSALTSHFPHAGFVVDGHTFENTSCVQEVFGSIKLVFQIWVSYNYVTNLRWQYDLMWDFLCQLEIRALLNSTIFTMLPSFLWVLAVGFFCFSTARRTKVVRNILECVPAGDEWQRIRCNKAAAKTNLSVSFALTLGNESAKGVSERRVSERRCVWTPCLYLSWCSCQCQQKINPRYTPNPLVHGIHGRFTSFSHVESNHPSFPHIFPMVSLWFPLYSWRFPRWIPRRLALLHWSPPARWWLVSWPSSQGTCGGCTHILLIHIINIIILVYHHNIFVIFVHNWYILFVHINICTLYL